MAGAQFRHTRRIDVEAQDPPARPESHRKGQTHVPQPNDRDPGVIRGKGDFDVGRLHMAPAALNGARGGNRTRKALRPEDFKSPVSTSFTTRDRKSVV